MPSILRVTSVWQGIAGAPGVTNMHWGPGGGSLTEAADAATSATRAFWDSIKSLLPNIATITVLQEVPLFDDATGDLDDVLNATTAPTPVVGTGGASYAAPAGAAITWMTSAIRAGKRLRGRSYLVPLTTNAFDAAGTLTSAGITTINAAATTLRTTVASPLMVWGRPNPDVAALITGVSANVDGHFLRDKAAVLTSRRD